MLKSVLISLLIVAVSFAFISKVKDTEEYDVFVYGATPAGISAAVTASKLGLSVVLVEPTSHIGGIITSGLGASDIGLSDYNSGFSSEFFTKLDNFYSFNVNHRFEPKAASKVFLDLLKKQKIKIYLERDIVSFERKNSEVRELVDSRKQRYQIKKIIDASYEGDLLALLGISFRVGRESSATYSEQYAGVSLDSNFHQFRKGFRPGESLSSNPIMIHGDLNLDQNIKNGNGDDKVQAYNFRLCVTKDKKNQVPFVKPRGYNRDDYLMLAKYLNYKKDFRLREIFNFLKIPNSKFDLNNKGEISTDFIGHSWNWPTASNLERKKIWKKHKLYTQGLLFFLSNDPSLPRYTKKSMQEFGLCKDEFIESQNWPPQLYVREARRMLGDYVIKESDILSHRHEEATIAVGSKPIESHHVQRLLRKDGSVINEGFIYPNRNERIPYEISYFALVPKKEEIENLIVPVALSASHVAYCAVRMEPLFMRLGQVSGFASYLSIKNSQSFSEVDYNELKALLDDEGKVVEILPHH